MSALVDELRARKVKTKEYGRNGWYDEWNNDPLCQRAAAELTTLQSSLEAVEAERDAARATVWQPIETAPKNRFILLWCKEDNSTWFAKWQGGVWHGVDELGLTREGHGADNENFVTGWAVNAWQPLPALPAITARTEEGKPDA